MQEVKNAFIEETLEFDTKEERNAFYKRAGNFVIVDSYENKKGHFVLTIRKPYLKHPFTVKEDKKRDEKKLEREMSRHLAPVIGKEVRAKLMAYPKVDMREALTNLHKIKYKAKNKYSISEKEILRTIDLINAEIKRVKQGRKALIEETFNYDKSGIEKAQAFLEREETQRL